MTLYSVPRAMPLPGLSASAFSRWAEAGDDLHCAWALRRAYGLLENGVAPQALEPLRDALERTSMTSGGFGSAELEDVKRAIADAASSNLRVAALWALELSPFIDARPALEAATIHVAATHAKMCTLWEARHGS